MYFLQIPIVDAELRKAAGEENDSESEGGREERREGGSEGVREGGREVR